MKNDTTLDYCIHSGIVGNRWVKDQRAYIVQVGENVYKVSWAESTRVDVSLVVNLGDKLFRGTIFFPRWVTSNPGKTVCFQNDHIPLMMSYHGAGSAYPTEVINEFATITFMRDCGVNNDDIITCAAGELPKNFPENLRQGFQALHDVCGQGKRRGDAHRQAQGTELALADGE